VLIFVWSWVLGPALAFLITGILPLAEPYVVVLLYCFAVLLLSCSTASPRLAVLWSVVLAAVGARVFAMQADQTAGAGAA
jgi:hypothetical protein